MEVTSQEAVMVVNHKKLTVAQIIKRTIFIIFGAALMGVGLEEFLVPNKILDGGIVGISIILAHLIGWKLGIFIFILNIPFFFIGYKQIGKTFALSTLLGITILSITTSLLHNVPVFTEDLLLATVFGGIVLGAGVGIVIRFGGSLDGTEIMAILLNKKLPFSVGEIVMFFNIFIFSIAGLIPVAGVIISLIPLSLIAYTIGGFIQVVYIWITIAIIHAIEAYILNPKLMSSKTDLPIFYTFIVLIFSEHYFGVWGLIIGIPIFVFMLDVLDVTNSDREKVRE